jgi:hypothetical protein
MSSFIFSFLITFILVYVLIRLLSDNSYDIVEIKINPKNPYDGFEIIETVKGAFYIKHKDKHIDKYTSDNDKYTYCKYAWDAVRFRNLEQAVSKVDDIIKFNLTEPKIHKINKNIV